MNDLIKTDKEKQVDEAINNLDALKKGKKYCVGRFDYYSNLSFMNEWEMASMIL
jgi:hypothetical protein